MIIVLKYVKGSKLVQMGEFMKQSHKIINGLHCLIEKGTVS